MPSIPKVTITNVDDIEAGLSNLSVEAKTNGPSSGGAGEPNDYISGFANLDQSPSVKGDANNNSKKDKHPKLAQKGSAPSTIHGISGSSANGDGSLPFKYRMVDAAAILTHPRLARNVHSVVMRAQSVGVESIVTLGMDIRGTEEGKRLAETYPHQVYYTTGKPYPGLHHR